MKVLWITTIFFPDIYKELNLPEPFQCGWIFSSAKNLMGLSNEIQLAVASTYSGKELKMKKINDIQYYMVPHKSSKTKYCSSLEKIWKDVNTHFNPDIVHIHGTEYPYALAYTKACGNKKVVVSIQGLVSVYEKYYYGGIDKQILRSLITIRDRIRFDSIFDQQSAMKKRGQSEIELIQGIEHAIGRTSWDKSHIWSNNPKAKYHFCNETLRDEFYRHEWEIENCEPNSIFISQAHYPIKGLHQLIKALPIILHHFPNTVVYVAGTDFITNRGLRINGFGKYILKLLKKKGLMKKVIFTGSLTEDLMCKRFLKSHVFVCPSSIENSPNSVGEAQLLGVPCVAAYVGGVSDMVVNNETGLLYRFEEVEMLAAAVCRIFSEDRLAQKLSKNGRIAAAERHSKSKNAKQLYSIYNEICNEQS